MKIQNKQYTAGDLARFYGLSLDTIRLYDRKGILPAQKKTDSDYRLYTRTDLLTLDHILFLKNAGLPLTEVNNLVNSVSIAEALVSCQNRLNALSKEIAQLQQQKQDLMHYTAALATLHKDWDKITLEMSGSFYMKDISAGMAETRAWLRDNGLSQNMLIAYNPEAEGLKETYHPRSKDAHAALADCYVAARILDAEIPQWKKVLTDGDWIWENQLCIHARFKVSSKNQTALSDIQRIHAFVQEHNFHLKGDGFCQIIFMERKDQECIDYYDCWYQVER